MTEKQLKAKVEKLSERAGKQRLALETTRRELTAAKGELKALKDAAKAVAG